MLHLQVNKISLTGRNKANSQHRLEFQVNFFCVKTERSLPSHKETIHLLCGFIKNTGSKILQSGDWYDCMKTLVHTQIPYFKRDVHSIFLLIYHYTKRELYLSMPRSFLRFSIKLHGSLNQSVSIWFPSNLGAFIIESILWPQLTGTVHGICPKVLTDKFIQMFIFPY